MRHTIAPTKNIIALTELHDALRERGIGIPGMGLIHGFAGLGKTTGISYLAAHNNAIVVRASAIWTPSAMLGALMRELGADPMRMCAPMLDYIIRQISITGRTLIVDDINQVLENVENRAANRMIETLRDIHDLSGVPVLLVGHQGTERLIQRPQLRRRLSESLEFKALDMDDARVLTDAVCEVKVADNLLEHLYKEMRGNVGFMIVGLSKIERLGRTNKLDVVDRDAWGSRSFGLGLGRVA